MAHVPTELAKVQALLQTTWAPLIVGELRETALIPSLVNTEFSKDILEIGDKVTVNMVKRPTGQTLTINKDTGAHRTIEAEELKIVSKDIVATKIFTASYELDTLAGLIKELDPKNITNASPIRTAMLQSLEAQINNFIYSKVAPVAANVITDKDTFNFSVFKEVTKLASKNKWPLGNRSLLLDVDYFSDLSSEEKMASADYVGTDLPMLSGANALQRSGFLIAEDNTDGLLTLKNTGNTGKAAIAFHKDFFYLALQQIPTFKISDMHGSKKRGYLVTVDLYGGGELGIDGDKLHAVFKGTAV